MHYNFDEIIDRRGTNALSTDGFRSYIFHAGPGKQFPYADEDFIRMWVADMEFATPPEIRNALHERIDRRIFGYTVMSNDEYYNSFSRWCADMYGWGFEKEELCFSQGIIPALCDIIDITLSEKTDKVLFATPSYGFFKHAADHSNHESVYSRLVERGGHFELDLDDLSEKAADPDVKLLIWCNPHNPTGRVWTQAELEAVAEIAEKNGLWIVSDEIHCDILRTGAKHIPMGKIMPDYDRLVTCMSASKTFNIAGLMFSDIIIRNKELREKFTARDNTAGSVNPLSLTAHKAGYDSCGLWLTELKEYLDGNFRYFKEFFDYNLPELKVQIPEATYLAWVNMSNVLPSVVWDYSSFFAYRAGVLLEGGDDLFVDNAKGWVRLNLAMPRAVLEEGLKRILHAIREMTDGDTND